MGWSGGVIVLSKLPVPGRPKIWMIVGQEPIAFAVGASGDCLDIFILFSLLVFPLSERRLDIDRNTSPKGCQTQNKQPTNQSTTKNGVSR